MSQDSKPEPKDVNFGQPIYDLDLLKPNQNLPILDQLQLGLQARL